MIVSLCMWYTVILTQLTSQSIALAKIGPVMSTNILDSDVCIEEAFHLTKVLTLLAIPH